MTGWRAIGPYPEIRTWSKAAYPIAIKALEDSPEPLRCGGTWAVGLDLMPNPPDGSIGGVPLPWQVLGLSPEPLHPAQISAVYPGYPQPSPDESAAAFRFRQTRDAAHLDGLLPIGPARQRMVKEPHAYILGLPLTDGPAAPLVVWEGSHRIMQAALRATFAPHPPEIWGDIDVTEAYQTARAEVFRRCRREEVPGRMGEAMLLHRHLIHGVCPWDNDVIGQGRLVAYFRPLMASVAEWMSDRP